MRGNTIHNQLLKPFAQRFQERRASIQWEYPTRIGKGAGFIDLFITYQEHDICIEAELSADRVPNDVKKAIAVNASLLLIVTPNAQVKAAAQRKLIRCFTSVSFRICFLTLDQFDTWFTHFFPCLNEKRKTKKKGARHEN